MCLQKSRIIAYSNFTSSVLIYNLDWRHVHIDLEERLRYDVNKYNIKKNCDSNKNIISIDQRIFGKKTSNINCRACTILFFSNFNFNFNSIKRITNSHASSNIGDAAASSSHKFCVCVVFCFKRSRQIIYVFLCLYRYTTSNARRLKTRHH